MRARDYYRKRQSSWPRYVLMAVLAVVMIASLAGLIDYGVQQQQTQSLHDELRASLQTDLPPVTAVPAAQTPQPGDPAGEEAYAPDSPTAQTGVVRPAATPTLPPWQTPEVLFTYQTLLERNPDLVGWLKMDRIYRVDFAVVQRDHSYYLRRDFDGKSNMNGTAFMDVSSAIWPRTDNLIIYAHNMKSGEMFGELRRLLNEDYYREKPLTTFNTLYERGTYVPLAAFRCSIVPGENYFDLCVSEFDGPGGFGAYIDRARQLSSIHPPYDAQWGDQLLTLVTCSDADEDRVVVLLRRIRPDEDRDALVQLWQ